MGLQFEDLEDDAIYALFNFLDVKGLVKFERLNQRIREINLSLQKCRTAALAFTQSLRVNDFDCGDPFHKPSRACIILQLNEKSSAKQNADQMLKICKKFPKTSSIYLNWFVRGSYEMGQEIGRACPNIKHICFSSSHMNLVEGILKETDVTHLTTMFSNFDCSKNLRDCGDLLRRCPNLTYFEDWQLCESRIAEFCPKLRTLIMRFIDSEKLSELVPRLTSIKSLSSSDLQVIAHKMDKLETLRYSCFYDQPFEAPEVKNFPNLAHLEVYSQDYTDQVLSYFVTGNHRIQSIQTKLWSNPHTLALINKNCSQLESLKVFHLKGTVDLSGLPLEEVGKIKHLKWLNITCFGCDNMKKIIEHIAEWKLSADCLIVYEIRGPSNTFPVEEASDLKMKLEKSAIANEGTKVKIIQPSKPLFEIFKVSNLPNLKAVFLGD